MSAALLFTAGLPHAFAANGVLFSDTVIGGQQFNTGETLLSSNLEFSVNSQADGNLCITAEFNNTLIWCSRNSAMPIDNYFTAMQTDGNLCTYRNGGANAWCSGSAGGSGPFFLKLQDDAQLCIFRGTPSAPVSPSVWCSGVTGIPPAHPPLLRYGQIYHVQNGHANWTGGYLDTRDSGCEGNLLCVSTAISSNRDAGSGSWMLVSAEDRAIGSLVRTGDRIYLKNQFKATPETPGGSHFFGGYLDVRGAFCSDNVLCVSTASPKNSNIHTSVWTIVGPRRNTYQDQSLFLRNNFVTPQGFTYLDTRGEGCRQNRLCVSTYTSPYRDSGSGSWRFQAVTTKK